MDLQACGSSLGVSSRCLKVPRLSVQTITRKTKNVGMSNHHTGSRNRPILSLRERKRCFGAKCVNEPRHHSRRPGKDADWNWLVSESESGSQH